jgi:hypothetical protein
VLRLDQYIPEGEGIPIGKRTYEKLDEAVKKIDQLLKAVRTKGSHSAISKPRPSAKKRGRKKAEQ